MTIDARISLVLCLGFASAGCSADADDDGPKIGMLLPFTGTTAATGANLERAVLSVAELFGDEHPIGGGTLALLTKDTHGDRRRTLAAVQELVDAGVVAIIGPESAELALEILPIVTDREVVFVSPLVSSGTQPVIEASTPWFRMGPSAEIIAKAMARDLLDRSAGNVAVLYEMDDYDQALAAHLQTTLLREGGVVTSSIALPTNRSSYRDELDRLLETDFQAVALLASPKGGAQVVNELQFIHPEPLPLFFGPALQTDVFLQNTAVAYIDGARGVAPAASDHDPAFDRQFEERWEERPLTGTYFYYDAAATLALGLSVAYADAEQPTYAELCNAIRGVSRRDGLRASWDTLENALDDVAAREQVFYSGLTGTMIMDAVGQRLQAGTEIWTISNGEIVAADEL